MRTGTVQVWIKSVPDGDMIGLPGLRGCPNHGSIEVDEAQILAYESLGYEWPESNVLSLVIPPDDESPVVQYQTENPADPEQPENSDGGI